MVQVYKNIILDVSRITPIQPIITKQGDISSRILNVSITNDGSPVIIPSTSTVILNMLRIDGQNAAYAGSVNSDGTVKLILPKWLMEVEGYAKCSISIIDEEEHRITTLSFTIQVEKTEYTDQDVPEEQADLIVQLISQISTVNGVAELARDEAEGYANQAEQARAIAQGYANQAEQSKIRAEDAANAIDGNNTTSSGLYSMAVNDNTVASGQASFAEGTNGIASGESSHVEGHDTLTTTTFGTITGIQNQAQGDGSHAEGIGTIAIGVGCHAEGTLGATSEDPATAEQRYTTSDGRGAHAEGCGTIANGKGSHSEGYNTIAIGTGAHAEGRETQAKKFYSHAEGQKTIADGNAAHAEGYRTEASGDGSHSEGIRTTAKGDNSHAEGFSTYKYKADDGSTAQDIESNWSNRTDKFSIAFGDYSHVEGEDCLALGTHAHAEGQECIASGTYSHAEGQKTKATNTRSHAEGRSTLSSGNGSHAEGGGTQATGENSHAEGYNTKANNHSAHAEGMETIADGQGSHAEGRATQATGNYSHAEGHTCVASGTRSHAEGNRTIAASADQHVQGKYNIEDNNGTYAHIVGAGSSSTRKNIHTLDWSGNAEYKGNVKCETLTVGNTTVQNIGAINVRYYYTLEAAATAISQNNLSSTIKKTDNGVSIEVIYLFSTIVINLLSDITINSTVYFKKSVIINTNGFNVVFAGSSWINMSEWGASYNYRSSESFVLNAKDSTFTNSSVDGSPFMFELYCSKVTINGGTFIHHCKNFFSEITYQVTQCETFAIHERNCIATLTECTIKTSGNMSAKCIYMSHGKELNLYDCQCTAAALVDSGYAYAYGQSYSKALDIRDVATCNIYKGYYSAECMAATFYGQRTIIKNSTFESCDHGVYFSGDKAHGFEVKFKHLKWSSLKCALLEFPFKEGEIKTKSNYTSTNPDYCNYGICYIGHTENRVKVALHRCTEINDNSNAKIVVSSNYNYKNTYLYLSSHRMLNGLRLDGVSATGARGHLILGWGITGEGFNHTNNALGDGYVNDTMFANDTFTTIESITDFIGL